MATPLISNLLYNLLDDSPHLEPPYALYDLLFMMTPLIQTRYITP